MVDTDSSNTGSGQTKIQEVYTRVFYNSKYSGTRNYFLAREHKVIARNHSKQSTSEATGMTVKTRPTSKNHGSDATMNCKVGDTIQSDQSNPVKQAEVSTASPCQILVGKLTNSSDKKAQGTINVVTPAIESNANQINMSNTKCESGIQWALSPKVVTSEPNIETTTVSDAFHKSLNNHIALNQNYSSHTRCDACPDKDITDDHAVLLFDIHNMCDSDKFLNTVYPKRVRALIDSDKVLDCVEFNQWRDQSQFDFGFIPLSGFHMPRVQTANTKSVTTLEAHSIIRQSGTPNFLHCRIPLETQLCIEEWQRVLKGYWDTQLIELLRFGFPLDYDRNSVLQCDAKNHSSAREFPQDIEAYLKEEIQFGAILGPFLTDPIPACHKSPFMTREKPNSIHRCVIVDLSWPKGFSVNSGVSKDSYLGTDFVLSLPTIDHITSCVKASGPGTHLYKIDISRAFRHVKIDPGDLDLLGLSWGDATYVDTCLPFGSRHGSQIFQRISDAVRHVMRRHGFTVINYVDGFIGVATPSVARRSYVFLQDMLKRLGLDVSVKKLVPPGTRVVCLGVEVDTRQRTVSIPEDKMRRIVDMVDAWATKHVCTKRSLQSLLGNLLYVHKCVAPARMFLNRMLELLRSNYDASIIKLTEDFKRDLRWFSSFLSKYNGVSFYDLIRTQHIVELDACLSGLGGRWENLVYHLPLPHHYGNLGIAQLEMVNILVAIRVFAPLWHRKSILIKCDNAAVVSVLTTGKAKDPLLAAIARNIWMELAKKDIQAVYKHIPGEVNQVADLLSRWTNSNAQITRLQTLVDSPMWLYAHVGLLDLDYDI